MRERRGVPAGEDAAPSAQRSREERATFEPGRGSRHAIQEYTRGLA